MLLAKKNRNCFYTIAKHFQLHIRLINVEFCPTKKLKCRNSILLRVLSKYCHNEMLSDATK